MQLKTRLLQYEKEIGKKEKEVIELYNQLQSQAPTRLIKTKNDTYLVTSLKKQLKDMKIDKIKLEDELNSLKKKTKVTKLQEMEVEIKMYIDECTRLRHLLEEVIQQKSMVGQEDMNLIEQKLNQQNNMLRIGKKENESLINKNRALEEEINKIKSTYEKDKSIRKSEPKEIVMLKKTVESNKVEIEKLKAQANQNKAQKDTHSMQTKIDQLVNHNNNLASKLEYYK